MEGEMTRFQILAPVIVLAIGAMPASAQEVERYRLERTDEGYVRIDTTTGRTSLCRERGGQLVCRLAVEEREAYDDGIAALQKRVEALEERITALEGESAATELPDDQEFEQTLSYMERFFRRFMGIVKDLEQDFDSDQPPQADRT
ncbi:hypothetical protein [Mesorhizobium sp. CAU 1741]|uniref:hypothetical protein n=1 Tax=Mesorhizobium sp. CAU 1741 TaxID=3140366 RepID=UPI00325C0172